MKKVIDKLVMTVGVLAVVSLLSVTTTNAQGSVSLQVFYDELQPYGTWMDHNQYGYVWIPRVERSFAPYATNGYWIHTEFGNTWVSDYEWGWAPFHYGRWAYDDFYGWIWLPDTEWAPAWVAWRSGGGYYGWAPLMPGIGIHVSVNMYHRIPNYYWNFVPHRYVTYRHVYRHCVPRPRVVNIINHTTIITHNYTDNRKRTYFTGPSRNDIERRGGGRVTVHKVKETNHPGRTEVARSTANFYKPNIDNRQGSRTRPAPSTYVRKDRTGKLEQIETRRERTFQPNAVERTNDFRYNSRGDQRQKATETPERKKYETNRDIQQREYTPMQRTPQREDRNRSYQPVQRERQPVKQDQQNVQRAPQVDRDVQRKMNAQPQRFQQIERQRTTGPNQNVQRQRSPTSTQQPSRSSVGQSHRTQQIERSKSGNTNRLPVRSTNTNRKQVQRERN